MVFLRHPNRLGVDFRVAVTPGLRVTPMLLTDTKLRALKPQDRPQRFFDGDGLYIEVRPNGGRWWRFKYRFEGKEKLLSFGTYPEVPLGLARTRRAEARQLVAAGTDPSAARKQARQARCVCRRTGPVISGP